MAKKKVQLKKTPSPNKAKKVSARKAEPKIKAKAVPASKAKATKKKPQPKKRPKAVPARKATATPKKKAKALPANKAKVAPKKAKTKKKATGRTAPKKLPAKKKVTKAPQNYELVATMPGSGPVVAEKPVSYPNLRRRVGELLDKVNDSALHWLHFKLTGGAITTAQQAEEARNNFSPLDRPALIQDLTTIAVDEFQLADDPDLAETLRDENSIWMFLTSGEKRKPSKDQKLLFPE
jgi:outer membrane biosynthesis protein TonB